MVLFCSFYDFDDEGNVISIFIIELFSSGFCSSVISCFIIIDVSEIYGDEDSSVLGV